MSDLSLVQARPGQYLFALQRALQGKEPDAAAFVEALRIVRAGTARVKVGHEDGMAFAEIEVAPKPLGELKLRYERSFVGHPGQVQEIERFTGHLTWKEACGQSGASYRDLSSQPALVEAAYSFLKEGNNPKAIEARLEHSIGQAKKYAEETCEVLALVREIPAREDTSEIPQKLHTTKASEDIHALLSRLERRSPASNYELQTSQEHIVDLAEGQLIFERGFLSVEDDEWNEVAMSEAFVLHLSKPDGSRICRIFSEEFETPPLILNLLGSIK